ncbi:MAG TPA: S-adenosylmethionine:tRNA ribosyltransferase-isomerase [Acidimicrobiales bacterium]|nr:S-adenosylmethionine:tRNA ribosyltransferase-isomerase [Acidimicrobiales bacterium]
MSAVAEVDDVLRGPSRIRFELPPQLEASVPPEARGITRDGVRLMVAYRSEARLVHANFADLPRFLDAGDLVVINTSGTLAAEVDATGPDGLSLAVHLSTQLPANLWVVELRRDGRPLRDAAPGWVLQLPEGGTVELLAGYERSNGRLWVASLHLPLPLLTYLAVHGRPIRYGYVRRSWPIAMYQNVYATEPGSAEMPSAGRPFTTEVITRLVAKGVNVAPLVLHTGVSSLESHEPPYAEYYRVDSHTAHLVNDTHRQGGRVVAIGTTVVRALETVADERGHVHPGEGWTETVITPDRGVFAVDGLLTGWHEPEASHLDMLEAIAGRDLVELSYAAALAEGYLWHEFGDVHLILP